MAKTIKEHNQINYVWSEISKTVFKFFLLKYKESDIFSALKGEEPMKMVQDGQERQKPLMKYG